MTSSSATRAIGSANSISTGCASTRRNRSSTTPARTSCEELTALPVKPRSHAHRHRRGERAAARATAVAAGTRRLRYRCHVERRLPSHRGVALTGRRDGYYHDYSGRAQELSRASAAASSTRASGTRGRRSRAARARGCRRARPSSSCRTTTRSATPSRRSHSREFRTGPLSCT